MGGTERKGGGVGFGGCGGAEVAADRSGGPPWVLGNVAFASTFKRGGFFFYSFFRPSGPTQPRTLTRTTLPRCLIEFWEGGGEGTGAGVETESATRPSLPPPLASP